MLDVCFTCSLYFLALRVVRCGYAVLFFGCGSPSRSFEWSVGSRCQCPACFFSLCCVMATMPCDKVQWKDKWWYSRIWSDWSLIQLGGNQCSISLFGFIYWSFMTWILPALTSALTNGGHDGGSLDICSRSSKLQQLRHAAAQQAVLEGSLVLDPPVTAQRWKKNSSASGKGYLKKGEICN